MWSRPERREHPTLLQRSAWGCFPTILSDESCTVVSVSSDELLRKEMRAQRQRANNSSRISFLTDDTDSDALPTNIRPAVRSDTLLFWTLEFKDEELEERYQQFRVDARRGEGARLSDTKYFWLYSTYFVCLFGFFLFSLAYKWWKDDLAWVLRTSNMNTCDTAQWSCQLSNISVSDWFLLWAPSTLIVIAASLGPILCYPDWVVRHLPSIVCVGHALFLGLGFTMFFWFGRYKSPDTTQNWSFVILYVYIMPMFQAIPANEINFKMAAAFFVGFMVVLIVQGTFWLRQNDLLPSNSTDRHESARATAVSADQVVLEAAWYAICICAAVVGLLQARWDDISRRQLFHRGLLLNQADIDYTLELEKDNFSRESLQAWLLGPSTERQTRSIDLSIGDLARGHSAEFSYHQVVSTQVASLQVPKTSENLNRNSNTSKLETLQMLQEERQSSLSNPDDDGIQQTLKQSGPLSKWDIDMSDIEIEGLIGKGGSGYVFGGVLGIHPVAIKQMKWDYEHGGPLHSDDPDDPNVMLLEAFSTEVHMIAECRHPGAATFYGISRSADRKQIFLVMELCPFVLSKVLADEKMVLSEATLCSFMLGVASTIEYMHARAMVHRDLKPSNVLLSAELQTKVTDFGTARFLQGADQYSGTLTTRGVGTPLYLPPETARQHGTGNLKGLEAACKLDVWAFGLMMWEIHTRSPLFPDERAELKAGAITWMQVVNRIALDGLRPIIPESCPKSLAMLMTACWAENPADRPSFTFITEVLRELAGSIRAGRRAGHGAGCSTPVPVPGPREPAGDITVADN